MTRLITGSAGTLGFISEATWRVSTMPERCAAITATGSLDACAATAREIVQSKLSPIYVTSLPDKTSGDWKIIVGFEGFSETVDYQMEKCGAVLEAAKLQSLEKADYRVHAGRFGDVYAEMGRSPFLLRAGFALDQVADFIKALDSNMLTPITLMKAVLPSMMEKGWGRVVNITSQSVKSPIAVLGLSNAARAGLTGYVGGTSRQVAPHGVTINNMLPGIHATDRAQSLDKGVSDAQGISMDEAAAQRMATIPARRYGTSAEFGAMCAFLCSQNAGFIVGQNILLDGGAVNATM